MRHRDFSRLTAEFSSALCKFNATCWPRWPGKKIWLFRSRARRCLNSAHSDWLLVSLSWLVLFMVCLLRSWCWSMALGQPICLEAKKSAERREDYIYIWTETYIIGFLYICRKHITISPYDYTHRQPRTHVHTHICTQTRTTWTQHMYIITTSHSKTSLDAHATRSVCLRVHTFKILPPNLTPHENNITSHTHIHIRITSRLRLSTEKQPGKRKYESDGGVMVGEFVCMYVCMCMYRCVTVVMC